MSIEEDGTVNIALHAVTPLCPYCGRPVRSSVELRAEFADLRMEAARAALRVAEGGVSSLAAAAEHDGERLTLVARLESLQAELRGEHLACEGRLH